MKTTTYRSTPFFCGSCGRALDFMHRVFPIAGAWYVHADNHRFRCSWRPFSTNTNSSDLLAPNDSRIAKRRARPKRWDDV